MVAGVVICFFALIPGLPKIPFLVIGALFIFVGRAAGQDRAAEEERRGRGGRRRRRAARRPGAPRDQVQDALGARPARAVHRLRPRAAGRRLGRRLAAAARLGGAPPDRGRGRHDHPVGPHPRRGRARSHEYLVKVRGTEVARGRLMAGHQLALDPGDAVGSLDGIPTTEPGLRPAGGLDHRRRSAPRPRRSGYTVVDAESRRRHAPDRDDPAPHRRPAHPPGRAHPARQPQGAQRRGRRRGRPRPALASASCSASCRRCCARASRSATSARSSRPPATGPASPATRSCWPSTPARRWAAPIVSPYLDAERTLRAITLDPAIEQEVSESIAQTPDGEYLAMDPCSRAGAGASLSNHVEQAVARGRRPVLICSSRVRRHLRRLCEQALPQLSVCAYNEIAPGISVETIGVVTA